MCIFDYFVPTDIGHFLFFLFRQIIQQIGVIMSVMLIHGYHTNTEYW